MVGLTRSWTARMERGARFKPARAPLPDLLRLLELEGRDHIRGAYGSRTDPVIEELDRLGIDSIGSVEATLKHPPGYYMMPTGWGGGVGSVDSLSPWVSEQLEGMIKLRSQLSAAEADQRHAFLIVAWEYMEHVPLTSSREGVPSEAPVLPDPIDAVWLTTMTGGRRVLAWLPDRGWIEGRPQP